MLPGTRADWPQLRVLHARDLARFPVSEGVSAVADDPALTQVGRLELLAQHRLDGESVPCRRPSPQLAIGGLRANACEARTNISMTSSSASSRGAYSITAVEGIRPLMATGWGSAQPAATASVTVSVGSIACRL